MLICLPIILFSYAKKICLLFKHFHLLFKHYSFIFGKKASQKLIIITHILYSDCYIEALLIKIHIPQVIVFAV